MLDFRKKKTCLVLSTLIILELISDGFVSTACWITSIYAGWLRATQKNSKIRFILLLACSIFIRLWSVHIACYSSDGKAAKKYDCLFAVINNLLALILGFNIGIFYAERYS